MQTAQYLSKIFILGVLLLLLTSCLWIGWESNEERGLALKEQEGFSLLVPSTWAEISENDLPLPKSGEIVFAYASPTQRQGYINNIMILSSENKGSESSAALMKSNASFLGQSLEDFTLMEEKDISFADDDTGRLVKFYGKYNTSTPEIVYLQTAKSCGEQSYFMTLSLAEKLESYDRYEYLLQSFECN